VGRRSGALARYLLDHAEVDACDIDRFAFAAIGINAAANRSAWLPSKIDLVGQDEGRDAVLAGEVC
jgi:predicted nicotinamide N-methyase